MGNADPRAPFWVAAALCGINTIFGYFALPESLKAENRRAFDIRRANPFGTFRILFQVRWVFVLVAALTFLYLAQQALQNTWSISTGYRFGWKPRQIGLSLALIGAMSIVVQMVVLRRLLPLLGEARTPPVRAGVPGDRFPGLRVGDALGVDVRDDGGVVPELRERSGDARL